MTFIVGLTCADGVLLCTDSLEDDGITKKTVDKIAMMGTSEWGIAIAGAGPGQTIEKLYAEVRRSLPQGKFDRTLIENTIETAVSDFQSKYVQTHSDQFQVLVAIYSYPIGHRSLYQASCLLGQSVVLSPVGDECRIGAGNELWRLMADSLYTGKNCVEDNVRLAIFGTRLAIKYASGVDGPVQVVSYTFGDQFWKVHSRKEIASIESELHLDSFQDALRRYWRLNNPPTRWEQVVKYKGVRAPGDELTLLEGVKLEELYTVSGRRRASKIFRRNTDRLQQRAIVEGKRSRAARSNASQPSSRNTRT